METAEYSYNGVEFFSLLLFSDLFKAFFEFVVQVHGNKMWCLFVTVHKVHESLVSCPLESHVLVEGKGYKIINFLLECQQFFGEINRIVFVLLILSCSHDGFTLFQDVRFHFHNDELNRGVDPVEHVVHQLKLVEFF